MTEDRYTIHVTVLGPEASAVFELTMHAKKDDLILPGMATPGTKLVIEYLAKATEE